MRHQCLTCLATFKIWILSAIEKSITWCLQRQWQGTAVLSPCPKLMFKPPRSSGMRKAARSTLNPRDTTGGGCFVLNSSHRKRGCMLHWLVQSSTDKFRVVLLPQITRVQLRSLFIKTNALNPCRTRGRQPRGSRLWSVRDRMLLRDRNSPTKLHTWRRTTRGVQGLLRFVLCYKFSFWFLQLAWKYVVFFFFCDTWVQRVYITRWQTLLKGCHTHGKEWPPPCGSSVGSAGTLRMAVFAVCWQTHMSLPLPVKRNHRLPHRERKLVSFLHMPN